MARQPSLPAELSPEQVVTLGDALLANAERLLQATLVMLDNDDVPLARSLAILALEESGKAIALHKRRISIGYAAEGTSFVDDALVQLWAQHGLKLEAVHRFLVDEDYWFDVEPSDPEENARVLGTIDEWKRNHNSVKQRGLYVDVDRDGDPVEPHSVADADSVREVVGHVHQIGWQLRLGEHIEGEKQRTQEQGVPPASVEDIERMRQLLEAIDPAVAAGVLESMRKGTPRKPLNNRAYAFVLPDNPFENVGRPGYEAQDRELWRLSRESSDGSRNVDDG